MKFDNLFPYETIREEQKTAIEFALETFMNSNKKFVVIEAGTGVGKSAIGYTVAQYLNSLGKETEDFINGAYFLTTQKILQDQYIKDFKNYGMSSIKSSSNYMCKYKKHNTCSDSQKELRTEEQGTKFWNACAFNCVYKKEKEKFLNSKLSVTNFPYFLTEAAYSGKITSRKFLVIDEAHNIESELSKFIEVSVSETFAKNSLKIKMPDVKTQFQAYKWIKDEYYPKILSNVRHVESMLEKFKGLKTKLKDFVSLSRQLDLLKNHHKKIEKFLATYDKENWVFELHPAYDRKGRRLEFKPIDVSPYAEPILFRLGEKVLMMSATILNKRGFCETLGIANDDVDFISIDSPFPKKNRPIFFCPIGKMSSSEIEKTLPKLAKAVESILERHKCEKGIIHAHSYRIANYLKKNLRNSRILIHDSSNREEVLKKHISSKKPTVLLSPSMTEGIDLKDDASRFQILCKVPYPYLGDKLVKKRMNRWKWWYPMQTAKSIVQSVGRSVRNTEDFAVTYILDADWDRFLKRSQAFFPDDFKGCLK